MWLTLDDFNALASEELRTTALGVAGKGADSIRRRLSVSCRGEEGIDDGEALGPGRADNEDELLVGGHGYL